MSYRNPHALVSTEWLAAHLQAPDVRVVDATWYVPQPEAASEPDARAEYAESHIPGAVYFDIDDIADETSELPHMLPSPEKFSSRVRKLGLGDGNRIVVYDNNSGIAGTRVWWMFRVFGHEDVAVLDGGLAKWRAEGRPTDDAPPTPRERHFTARANSFLVRDKDQVRNIVRRGAAQLVDARGAGRFSGELPEPRPGLVGGHIPGSVNLPYAQLLSGENGTFVGADDMAARFRDAGLDMSKPIVATCGSGVSACVLAFGLYLLGVEDAAVYDGSWSEWGADAEAPKETGPAA